MDFESIMSESYGRNYDEKGTDRDGDGRSMDKAPPARDESRTRVVAHQSETDGGPNTCGIYDSALDVYIDEMFRRVFL